MIIVYICQVHFQLNTKVEEIVHPLLEKKGIQLFIKRDDLIHPEVSGNKWRKLVYNIEKFHLDKREKLLTFGGAFSNHIAATAAAGKIYNVPTIGVIRGDEFNSNPTLDQAKKNGMHLHFVSREEYSWKDDESYLFELRKQFGNIHIVPEGGANYEGIMGCMDIIKEQEMEFEVVCCPAGTGATSAGIAFALPENSKLEVYPALKGDFHYNELLKYFYWVTNDKEEAKIMADKILFVNEYNFGGFAKVNQELINFVNEFYTNNLVPLDLIYNGKMMYGIFNRISEDKYPSGTKILVIHTGGIQGNEGFKTRKGIKLNY